MKTETDQQRAFADVWSHICDLGKKDGVTPLNKLSEPWRRKVGSWEFWMNGTDGPRKGGPRGDVEVPQFNIYVEFNGWPAGLLDPYSGTIAAGELANIFTFRDTLKAELAA